MEELTPPIPSLADAPGSGIRPGERCSLTVLPFSPRGSSGAPLTGAWFSQHVDKGDIGEDDIGIRHGLYSLVS